MRRGSISPCGMATAARTPPAATACARTDAALSAKPVVPASCASRVSPIPSRLPCCRNVRRSILRVTSSSSSAFSTALRRHRARSSARTARERCAFGRRAAMAAKRYYTFAAVAAGQKNMQPDFVALRRQFPLLAHKTYLNSGSYGALSLSVQAAFAAYLEERLTLGASWDGWVAKNEAVRARTAQLLHCLPQEIAVTASVSAGLNALASALDFSGERNQVIVSDFEFPTTAQIWHAQAARGAHIIHVPPAADGYIPVEQFARSIGERTRLVAITHVCYRNGARLDVPAIVRLAHARGAQVLLDCYQSVGSLDINVRALDVDFAAGGMLKYLIGTAGIGFLYVREALTRTLVPTHTGWFAQADIGAMDIYANDPAPNARRFEAGTPAVPNCYA